MFRWPPGVSCIGVDLQGAGWIAFRSSFRRALAWPSRAVGVLFALLLLFFLLSFFSSRVLWCAVGRGRAWGDFGG